MRNSLNGRSAVNDRDRALMMREGRESELSQDQRVMLGSDPLLNLVSAAEKQRIARAVRLAEQARRRAPAEKLPEPTPRAMPPRSIDRKAPDHSLFSACMRQSHSWLNDRRQVEHKFPLNRKRYKAFS